LDSATNTQIIISNNVALISRIEKSLYFSEIYAINSMIILKTEVN